MAISYAVISITSSHINYQIDDDKIKNDIDELLDDDEIVNFYKLEDLEKETFAREIVRHVCHDVVEGTQIFIGDNFYQTMFYPRSNVQETYLTKLNMLGTQINNGILTESAVVIFKYNIKSDTEIEFANLTRYDLYLILEDKFFHKGVMLRINNNMELYTYQQNMLDAIAFKYGIPYVEENFLIDDVEFGNMVFKIAHNKNEKVVNEKMSKIAKNIINGDVWCSLHYKSDHLHESIFISINKEHLYKILEILENPNFNSSDIYTNITAETAQVMSNSDNGNDDSSQIVISPYTKIDRMYKKYKK